VIEISCGKTAIQFLTNLVEHVGRFLVGELGSISYCWLVFLLTLVTRLSNDAGLMVRLVHPFNIEALLASVSGVPDSWLGHLPLGLWRITFYFPPRCYVPLAFT
jgi:hypothetical protein